MQVIELRKPTDWHPKAEEQRLLSLAGITFTDPVQPEGHFATVTLSKPPIETAQILGGPAYGVIMNFSYSCFEGTLMQEIAGAAHSFRHLQSQKQGLLTPRPFSAPLAPRLPGELAHLSAALRHYGIDEVKIGLELETTALQFPVGHQFAGANRHWQDMKESVLGKIGSGPKADAIETFNAREMMMYDIVELDPRTCDIVQPMFGTQGDGGYYDAQNVLELKLKHTDPQTQRKNRRMLVDVLYEKANEYGLTIDPPQYHVNFSFWKDGRNIFDPKNPALLTDGKKIVEGMTRAFYDSFPLLNDPAGLHREAAMQVTSRTDREGFMRLADGRFEARLAGNGDGQDPDLVMAVGMAGATWGLSADAHGDTLEARHVRRANFSRTTPDVSYIAHVLQGSHIGKDGHVIAPENYIKHKAAELGAELGIVPADYAANKPAGLAAMFEPKEEPFLPFLLGFFRRTRVEDNGAIHWPVPSHRVPPGANNPPDIEKLRRSISCAGIVDSFVVDPGYDLNDTDNVTPDRRIETLKHARIRRMQDSLPLKGSMTSGFCAALSETLEENFGIPRVAPEALADMRRALASAKWEYLPHIENWRGEIPLNSRTQDELSAALTQILHEEGPDSGEASGSVMRPLPRNDNTLVFISAWVHDHILPRLKDTAPPRHPAPRINLT